MASHGVYLELYRALLRRDGHRGVEKCEVRSRETQTWRMEPVDPFVLQQVHSESLF